MKKNNELLGVAVVISFFFVIGVSVNYHHSLEETVTIEQLILERAYEDVVAAEEADDLSDEDVIIKIFDGNHELVDSRVLRPEELPDQEFSNLMNQSLLMAEYNNSYIYKIKHKRRPWSKTTRRWA